MYDMLMNPIVPGDTVLYPGGNARYGGLKMMVGIVVKMTAKRMSLLTNYLEASGKPSKVVSKTGAKVLVCKDVAILSSQTVEELRAELEE